MNKATKKALKWGAATAGTAAAVYGLVIRPWHKKWGAEPIDVKRPMPGDEIVPDANDVTNRAINIKAEPQDIWPWLVQMGYQRGGSYSYDRVNQALGYLEGPSSETIEPQYQNLEKGDVIPMGAAGNLKVASLQKERALVLVPEDLPGAQASWSIALTQYGPDQTRLVCRTRLKFGWSPRDVMYRLALDPATFLMFRKWFLGVKERAERTAMARRQHERLEAPETPQPEYRPRQQPPTP